MSDAPPVDAARLRVTLLDLDPAPWREIEVPLSMNFKGLHDTLQAAFLWGNQHLWEFEVAGRRYGTPFDDDFGGQRIYKAGAARLTLLREAEIGDFLYVYDMGDDWQHKIEVLAYFAAESGARLPRFLGGRWRTPPEDIGGPPGFEAFLEAITDPKHPDHEDILDWYGDGFDREDIEEEIVRIQMGRLAKARARKK